MFLCFDKNDIEQRGWNEVDFVLVSGDAYVDHPSFGTAIIGRLLESKGYKVAILAQPDWNATDIWLQFGRPRLAFLVTGGNIDSMVAHYSVNKKRRSKDSYSDNGEIDKRPDRATIVYCQCIRRHYKDVPIIIGGIEASLRKLAHYDYWDDLVRPSILLQSSANLLIYGMAEKAIIAVAQALENGIDIDDLSYIPQTVYKTKHLEMLYDYQILPSYQQLQEDKKSYCESTNLQYANSDAIIGKMLVQEYADKWMVVVNPPYPALTSTEMDEVYNLPFERTYHPHYAYVPAIEEVQFSIIANRGCFGGCAFCALTLHQGRSISSRSVDSVVTEAIKITNLANFKGYIHDIGGPTANFLEKSCVRQQDQGVCPDRQCLSPSVCPNLDVSHHKIIQMLQKVAKLPKVKKVFIRSGVRYDYALLDKDSTFLSTLVESHISGQLKVAPEHCSESVLQYMQKSSFKTYLNFKEIFQNLNIKYQKQQYLVPYFMSSHPGATLSDAIELAQYLKASGSRPEQVQDFYPTPATIATCMYYTELDPKTMKKIEVAKDYHSKIKQRALLQFYYPKNQKIVYQALKEANRLDLVGYTSESLIKPLRNKCQ